MIDKQFWIKIAQNWATEDDGIAIPDDKAKEAEKAKGLADEELQIFDELSNDEMNDILAELGFDDF